MWVYNFLIHQPWLFWSFGGSGDKSESLISNFSPTLWKNNWCIYNCIYLKWIKWWFDIPIHCGMITQVYFFWWPQRHWEYFNQVTNRSNSELREFHCFFIFTMDYCCHEAVKCFRAEVLQLTMPKLPQNENEYNNSISTC